MSDPAPERFETRVIPREFDAWYADVAPRLLASLRLVCGDRDTAADVCDEALLRSLERWHRVRTMEAPEGWVYRVAVNIWKRQQRRRSRATWLLRRTVAPVGDDHVASLPAELWALIAGLPERQREVLVLRLVLGLSQAETAETLAIAQGSVASALHDARAAMRVVLQSDEPEVSR